MAADWTKTDVTTTVTFTATLSLTFLESLNWTDAAGDPAGGYPVPPYMHPGKVAILLGGARAELYLVTTDPDPLTHTIWAHTKVTAGTSDEDDTEIGRMLFLDVPDEHWVLTLDGGDTYTVTATITAGPYELWKRRIVEPGFGGTPQDSVHWQIEQAWKPATGALLTATIGALTVNTSLTGSLSQTLPNASVEAGLVVLPATVHTWPNETAAEVNVTTYSAAVSDPALYRASYVVTYSDCEIVGNGNQVSVNLLGSSQNSVARTVTKGRYPDRGGYHNLKLYNWNQAYAGNFLLPVDDPTATGTEAIAADVAADRWYMGADWWSGAARPTYCDIALDPAWTDTAGETVDPTDLVCTILEAGVDPAVPTTDYSIPVLKIRREPAVSIQWPADLAANPASDWVATGTGISAARTSGTKPTTVTVTAGGSGSVTRTFASNYESWSLGTSAGDGWDELGLPLAYQDLRHHGDVEVAAWGTDPSDVQNWQNYGWMKITLDSTAAMTLGLAGTLREYDVSDTHHPTLATRVAALSYSTSDEAVDLGSLTVAASSGQEFYVELPELGGALPKLWTDLTLSGFTPGVVVIQDVELVPYNPTALTETGDYRFWCRGRRVDGSDALLDRVRFYGTAEGGRCLVVPDAAEDRTAQGGIPSGEPTAMTTLESVALALSRQEGLVVDGAWSSPQPWDNTSTAYAAALQDGTYDMIGDLYTGDVVPVWGQQVSTHASTLTELAVRPQCSRLKWADGVDQNIVVRHHLRGCLHGLVRNDDGTRAGGAGAILWQGVEVAGVVTDIESLAAVDTDDWGYVRLAGGFRELALGSLTSSADSPGTDPGVGWLDARNRGLDWVLVTLPEVVAGTFGGDNIVPMRAGAELLVRVLEDGDNYRANVFRRASFTRPWALVGAVGDAAATPQRPLSAGPAWRHMVRQADTVERYSADLGDTYADATGSELDLVIRHVYDRTDLVAWGTGMTSYSPLGVALEGDGDLVAYPLSGAPNTILAGVGADAQVLIDQSTDGRYHVMIWDGTSYKQYRSDDQMGASWGLLRSDTIGTGNGALYAVHWHGRSGLAGTAGYHDADNAIYVWRRASIGAAWSTAVAVSSAVLTGAVPYLYERPTGEWECGWLYGSTWKRYVSGDLVTWSVA